jgi:hypothetical protein
MIAATMRAVQAALADDENATVVLAVTKPTSWPWPYLSPRPAVHPRP